MYVVATAGHVDHGKSTLVRALTGMEPDRWEEEKRRGLTIDLGFVWTHLPSGADVAFVDVPGHERFLSNMLAGVGPVPVALFVVAADEGWQAQSSDHRDALDALGVGEVVVALTRADRADEQRRARVRAEVREELAATSFAEAPMVEVSARTGEGLEALKAALDELLAAAPAPDAQAPVRFWVDRAFSVKGAGTVVTGTLAAGRLAVGDTLELRGHNLDIRGLHSENTAVQAAEPVSRVAINLRGVDAGSISRGDVLLSPGAWQQVSIFDAQRVTGEALDAVAENLVLHVGTAAVEARVRPLSAQHARVSLSEPLPLRIGDRAVLRGPGARHVVAGVEVVDPVPPAFTRRGDAARRASALAALDNPRDAGALVVREGYVLVSTLQRLGFDTATPPAGVIAFRQWWVAAAQVGAWKKQLLEAVEAHAQANPLASGLPRPAAAQALTLDEGPLLNLAIAAAKLESAEGVLRLPGATVDLGPAEKGVRELEQRLEKQPFAAPEADDLARWGLGPKELAAAERAGRVLRLGGGVVLLPSAPQRAVEILRTLEQPFSTSQARKAWDTTRRVAIPLLELLDAHSHTRRLDGTLRELR
ncbi:selenocysteine-specific translation elongation factor [Corynebacterium sp.]|uniref:selenocysteine-specific translation elongation factor n=1 Tax=Corynebacterium sp. TaxID=1720 RepID=UPI0026DCEA6D|nr:selenocysteine-specific translation elongation factor [Corynebacterium sp.]MDO5032781.1 selenocysteine-specific translation elongation factor [Corynebacterium sp.]